MKGVFAKNFARNYERKLILGTSDAWSTSRLSHQTNNPAYYIEDCRIYSSSGSFKIVDTLTPSMSEVSQPITVIAKIASTLPLFVTMMYFDAFLFLHITQFESNSVKFQNETTSW